MLKMKSTHVFFFIFLMALTAVVIYSFKGGRSPEDYAHKLQVERDEKDLFMKNGENSPMMKFKKDFNGLRYFPPDLTFRISAELTPLENKKMILLSTSDGTKKKYLEYGYAEFELAGVKNKLLILEITEPGPYRGTLYLAFADETSGKETYGAGRYLDLKKVPGATSITLDFNAAYNPYCAYSDDFSCPFPPKENVLKVAIRAGEKVYQ
jgi:uncharacterized protein